MTTATIFYDDDAESPREWDNLGTMYCEHGVYRLGDDGADDPRVEAFDIGGPEPVTEDELTRIAGLLYDAVAGFPYENPEDRESSRLNLALLRNKGEDDYLDTSDKAEDFIMEAESDPEVTIDPDILFYLPLYLYDHSGITMSHGGFSCPWDSGKVGTHYITREDFINDFPDIDPDSDEAKKKCEKALKSELDMYDAYLRGDIWYFVIEDEDGDLIDSCSGFYGDDSLDSMKAVRSEEYHELLEEAWENRFENI